MDTITPVKRSVPSVSELGPRQGLAALKALRSGFSGILPLLEMVQRELGDIFQLTLPGFRPVFISHPDAIRQVLVDQRDAFLWRPEGDPVARLLRHGVLVTDGEEHAHLRGIMEPSAQRKHFAPKADVIRLDTDRVQKQWQSGQSYDMLVEMRKLALLAFESVYFSHDLEPELERIWEPILKALGYISPGLWIMRPDGAGPPPKEVLVLDMHLYDLIHERRAEGNPPDDLLTHLVQALDDDDLVRDQMMTMLIAGHDTSTALLAWTLYLLGAHPEWMEKVQSQIWDTLGSQPPTPENTRSLTALDQVIKESLRLYPPIHVGNRFTAREVELMGYTIPAGTRLMYSIYLVQRHPDFWEAPDQFQPERFASGYQTRVAPFTYLPFGGGPRNCIGGSFAQLEARIALARLLQTTELTLLQNNVKPNMGATLEPRPDVTMRVEKYPRLGKMT
jgi:cytochrome P450